MSATSTGEDTDAPQSHSSTPQLSLEPPKQKSRGTTSNFGLTWEDVSESDDEKSLQPPSSPTIEPSPLFREDAGVRHKKSPLHRSSHGSSPSQSVNFSSELPPSKSERTISTAAVDENPSKTLQPPLVRRNSSGFVRSLSQRNLVEVGELAYYINDEKEVLDVKVMDKEGDPNHPLYKIKLPDETEKAKVHHTKIFKTHPLVHKILCVLNLCEGTDKYLRKHYPTVAQFETFLHLSFEAIKTYSKVNGRVEEYKMKEPRFKRSDREEMIILGRFARKNVDEKGNVNWEKFNEDDFNTLREEAPKEDLLKVLKELGIDNVNVVNALKAKSVLTPAHFVQKPKSWFGKLEISTSTLQVDSDLEQNEQPTYRPLLNGTDKFEIERFKQWYTFHMVGCLPPDWVVSFRNDEVHSKERNMRKVLRTIGLSADVIDALKRNDIRDVTTLNRTSKNWKTEKKCGEEEEDMSNSWQRMGLTRNDAADIINFRHWYHFYVAGRLNMRGWALEFNIAQYDEFIQRYQPGDNFKLPLWLKIMRFFGRIGYFVHFTHGLKFPQERQDYYDVLQKAADSGDVSNEQRYHLIKYYEEKREKLALIKEITSNHYDGLGDTSQQEKRLHEMLQKDILLSHEKEENDLMFSQLFCQFYFSATLVLTLLAFWIGTTTWFVVQYWMDKNAEDYVEHPGYDYVTFVHNVLFGLVSAAVIQELSEESTKTSLYYRFLPTYREKRQRQKEYQIRRNLETARDCKSKLRRCIGCIWYLIDTWFVRIILWSTRFYITAWIVLGCTSLAFAAIAGVDTTNPLYTTGQAWLGIAVTIGYTYFGLNDHSTSAPASNSNTPSSSSNVGAGAGGSNSQTDHRGGVRADESEEGDRSDHQTGILVDGTWVRSASNAAA